MEDHIFLEDIQHVNRGRIPERLVHAKGTGAHGYFEVTNDISKYCAAKLFNEIGKRTAVFARFSVSLSQLGSSDTRRSPRGAGIKFYTEDGNWDLTTLNEPIFPINTPLKALSMGKSNGPNPRSNLQDPNTFWEYYNDNPEMSHFMLLNFSDRGIPDGYRYLNMWAISTQRLINRHGEAVLARFQVRSNQGFRALDPIRAAQLAGADPDYASRDLSDAITRGDYPSYTVLVQVMTEEQAEKLPYDPMDNTKVWSQKPFPPLPIGKIVLTANTKNHWDESEQAAFSPANIVPGIRHSADKMLADRLFIYKDTQMWRLGVNHNQLPVNRPINPVANYQREGRGVFVSQGAAPHYFPNSFGGPVESVEAQELDTPYKASGDVKRYEEVEPDHYSQPRAFWRNVIDEPHRVRLVANIAASLRLTSPVIQQATVKTFSNVDDDLARMLDAALNSPADV